MESPVKNTSGESPDVTGVSRSGRVRKKSSKLADFESPDEIDTRFKRKTDRPQKSPQKGSDVYDESDGEMDDDLLEVKDEPLEVDDWGDNDDGDEDVAEGDDNDDGDEGNDPLHVDDDSTDMPRETSNYSQAQSLYLSEKQGKKNIMLKDGQVVQRKKAQRKDKGKSRFTAYMLWAREIRPGIIQANPNMDFSAVNKRLGELWALVPTTQKYNWKRRAKRLAAKGNQKGSMISTGKAAKQSQNTARSNLINKGGVKPQQVVRTSAKQSDVGPPAPTQKAHTSTPKAKNSYAKFKFEKNKTGGGPPPAPKEKDTTGSLMVIQQERDPLHNAWDMDAGLQEQDNSQARNLSFTSKTTNVGETSQVTSSEVICCSDDDTELELISGPVGKSTEKGKPIHKKLRAKTEKQKSQIQISSAVENYYKQKMELETQLSKRTLEHLEECHQEKIHMLRAKRMFWEKKLKELDSLNH
nr:FACT complex subunit SSRP1-like isoform X2 [Penaeus vannamei]